MHSSLANSEVQLLVFSYILDRKDFDLLFCLAISCKTFSRNALNLLWSAPPDMGVLIHTMPSDLWMETKPPKKAKTGNRSLKFTRPLSEGDWERFNFYAPMIRVMHLKSRVFSVQTHPIEYVSINPAVFAAFNDYAAEHKIKSFLPRLRSAAIHLDNNAFAKNTLPLLGCFMSPEITSIDLLPPRNPTVLNQLISQNCPNLTTLNVPNGALDGLVPTLASGMPKVTAIRGELASAKSDLPDFLGALPLLQSLRTLVVDCHTEFSSLTTAGGRFQNLVDLNIKAFDWKELAKLFTHLRCGFETLQIFLHNPRQGDHSVPKSYGFQKLINALGSNERLATTLTKLTITDKRQETIQFMEDLGDPFPPLFSLKALQHLVVRVDDVGTLNDDWIETGALAWPNLQTLIIYGDYYQDLSLKGLIPLLTHCRQLKALEVHPAALGFDVSLLPADGSAVNPHITGKFVLHKAKASDVDPAAVFACLQAMFPNVTRVARSDAGYSDYAEYYDPYWEEKYEFEYADKWAQLEELFDTR